MSKFSIDPEVESLLPGLTTEENATLTGKLKAEGCQDELVTGIYPGLKQPILMDGHNRYRICQKHKIKFYVRPKPIKFDSRESLLQWVIDNQLGRRNLTDERRAYYRGKDYLNAKQARGGDRKSDSVQTSEKSKCQNDTLISTAEKVAEKHGVSPATIHRNAKFAEAVDAVGATDPKAKEAILNGQAELSEPPSEDTPLESDPSEEFCVLLNTMCRELDDIARRVGELKNSPYGRFVHWQSAQTQIKNARETLHGGRPTHECPYCKAAGEPQPKCRSCGGLNVVTKSAYKAGIAAVGGGK